MTPTILCVDDSKTIRLVLTRLFRPFVCEVCEAADGEQGLAMARQKPPDLIILDFNMPVLDGLEMLRRLREEPAFKRTPVIMLTAESSGETVGAAARLGVRDYLIKPFREDEMLAKVGRVIPLTPRPVA